MQKTQTFQKPKKSDTPSNVPTEQKGMEKHISFSFSSSSTENSDQKESEKTTREKVTLLSFFETRIKEQRSSHR